MDRRLSSLAGRDGFLAEKCLLKLLCSVSASGYLRNHSRPRTGTQDVEYRYRPAGVCSPATATTIMAADMVGFSQLMSADEESTL